MMASNNIDEIKKEIEQFLTHEYQEVQKELIEATQRFQYNYTDEAAGDLRKAHTKLEFLVEISDRMKEVFTIEEPEFVQEAHKQRLGFTQS